MIPLPENQNDNDFIRTASEKSLRLASTFAPVRQNVIISPLSIQSRCGLGLTYFLSRTHVLTEIEEPDGSDDSWLYWQCFEPKSGGDLEFCFSDFEGTPTYKLISFQRRKEYIERMVSIVNEFVRKLENL